MNLVEHPDRYIVEAEGLVVDNCRIDYQFRVDAVGPGEGVLSIILEGSFVLECDSTRHELSAERPASLTPALEMLHRPIDRVSARKDGRLEVTFSAGCRIIAVPDPDYESWQICTTSGSRIVCMPGGELAVWR